VPVGPTFASVECRLADLGLTMSTLPDATPGVRMARDRLGTAITGTANARALCADGDARRAKKSLKTAFRKLGRLRAVLGSKAAKSIPGRDELRAAVDEVRTDVRALKAALSCPAAAGTAARG
jgi:hypothetical protein